MSVWLPDWMSNFLKSKFWKLFKILLDQMVSIIISIIQHEQYFPFHATSCSSLMSHRRVNNKCNRVKGQHWRWLSYALYFLLCNNIFHVSRSNHHYSWKFHEFYRKTPVLESLFKNAAGMQAYFVFVFLYTW